MMQRWMSCEHSKSTADPCRSKAWGILHIDVELSYPRPTLRFRAHYPHRLEPTLPSQYIANKGIQGSSLSLLPHRKFSTRDTTPRSPNRSVVLNLGFKSRPGKLRGERAEVLKNVRMFTSLVASSKCRSIGKLVPKPATSSLTMSRRTVYAPFSGYHNFQS